MTSPLHPAHHAAWRTLLAAHRRLVAGIDSELRACEVAPLEWYDVLLQLRDAPGRRLRLGELADAVLLTRSGVSRLVGTLEREKLVRRVRCPEDGRGVYAELTARGLALQRRTWPVYRRAIATSLEGRLGVREAESLAEWLGRFAAG